MIFSITLKLVLIIAVLTYMIHWLTDMHLSWWDRVPYPALVLWVLINVGVVVALSLSIALEVMQ